MSELRPLAASDTASARALLVEAFHDDPNLRWCFLAEAPGFEERLSGYVALGHRWHVAQGHPVHAAYEEDALVGVLYAAVPEPPEPAPVAALEAELVSACGAEAASRFAAYNRAVEARLPPARFYVLALLAVQDACRGRGLGSALVRWLSAACDADPGAAGVVLDTALERNVRFYARLGYRELAALELAPGLCQRVLFRPRAARELESAARSEA